MTDAEKHPLVRSVRSSMLLSGMDLPPYAESMAVLERVLLEPPLVFGGRERIIVETGREPMTDEIAQSLGFADAEEFFRMTANVDFTARPAEAPGNRLALFKAWQEEYGTKSALLAAFPELKAFENAAQPA